MIQRIEGVFDRDRLISYINGNNFDVIARCSTKWHMLAINSYINMIASSKTNRNLICAIYAPKDLINSICSNDTYAFNKNVDFYFIISQETSVTAKIINVIKILFQKKKNWRGHSTTHVISPNSGWYFLANKLNCDKYFPKLVIIEDGFAHYNSEKTWISESKNIKTKLLTAIQFKAIKIVKHKTDLNEIEFTLFDRANNMKVNDNVVFWFKYTLKLSQNSSSDQVTYIDDKILFLTQPLVDDGHIDGEHLEFLYKQIVNKLGDKLVVRIHPRDKFARNLDCLKNFIIPDDGLNAEEYYGKQSIRIRKVIGFNTTTLISLMLFYDAKPISLIHIIDNLNIDDYLRNSFENFEKLFGNAVIFPDDLDSINYI